MAELRVTQGGASVAYEIDPNALRVSQGGASVAYTITPNTLKVSQAGISVLWVPVPLPPDYLTATAISHRRIDLTWVNNLMDRDGLQLERSVDGLVWVVIANLDADATTYRDKSGLSASTEYFYRIAATYYATVGAYGSTASATTMAAPGPHTPRGDVLYELRFRDATGALYARIGYGQGGDPDVLRWFSYRKALGYAGMLTFSLTSEHPVLTTLANNHQIEVWRSVDRGVTWYMDFVAIYRTDLDYEERPRLTFGGYATGPLSLMEVIIAWMAGTSNRTVFTAIAAETVMKTLVTYNATAAATAAAGRDLTFACAPFTLTVAADGGAGNAVSKGCSRKPLLETLREISRVGGGDFDLTRDSTNPLAYEFDFYAGQRGVDRHTSMIFSSENGNLRDFRYTYRRAGANVAIVGGPGDGATRQITVVYGTDYTAQTHREVFINATDLTTDAARQVKGYEHLYALRAVETTGFVTRQVDGARYGLNYAVDGHLGDLVTVVRSNDLTAVTHKIVAVTVTVNQDGEEVTLETETP